jgi:hypothetical protein
VEKKSQTELKWIDRRLIDMDGRQEYREDRIEANAFKWWKTYEKVLDIVLICYGICLALAAIVFFIYDHYFPAPPGYYSNASAPWWMWLWIVILVIISFLYAVRPTKWLRFSP